MEKWSELKRHELPYIRLLNSVITIVSCLLSPSIPFLFSPFFRL